MLGQRFFFGAVIAAGFAGSALADAPKEAGRDPAKRASSSAAAPAAAANGPYLYFRPLPTAARSRQAPSSVDVDALSTFTPPSLDVRQGARGAEAPAAARRLSTRSQTRQSGFTFTPSGRASDLRALSISVVAETVADQPLSLRAGERLAVQQPPTGANVALAVGYRGFAVEAGFAQLSEASRPLSRGVDLGLSYSGADWKTSLHVIGQDFGVDPLTQVAPFATQRSYSVELGAAYQLSSSVALTGGMRYAISTQRPAYGFQVREQGEQRSGSVFLGTAVSF